jgi:hypothetical protein
VFHVKHFHFKAQSPSGVSLEKGDIRADIRVLAGILQGYLQTRIAEPTKSLVAAFLCRRWHLNVIRPPFSWLAARPVIRSARHESWTFEK